MAYIRQYKNYNIPLSLRLELKFNEYYKLHDEMEVELLFELTLFRQYNAVLCCNQSTKIKEKINTIFNSLTTDQKIESIIKIDGLYPLISYDVFIAISILKTLVNDFKKYPLVQTFNYLDYSDYDLIEFIIRSFRGKLQSTLLSSDESEIIKLMTSIQYLEKLGFKELRFYNKWWDGVKNNKKFIKANNKVKLLNLC